VFDAANSTVLKGVGVITAGDTTITAGDASGTWTTAATSSGATLTITPNKIEASHADVTFTAAHAASAITVTAGTLEVQGQIVLTASAGKVDLAAGAAAGIDATLLLKGGAIPGILTTGAASASTPVTAPASFGPSPADPFTLTGSSGTATVIAPDITGSVSVTAILIESVVSGNISSVEDIGRIGGGAVTDAAITVAGPSGAITLDKGLEGTIS
jgi:hypothetical protein